jgi:hypothetical protein
LPLTSQKRFSAFALWVIASVAQAVQNVRKMAAELVFSLQRNAESEDVINYIKSLQGGLLGLQVYGAISEAELENYLIETDKIQDLIEKQ